MKCVLCCCHEVESFKDGVFLQFDDGNGAVVSGMYCKECADRLKKTAGAWEVKIDESDYLRDK